MSSDEECSSSVVDISALAVVAKPLSTPKLEKRLLKLTKKAAKEKLLKRGVKEVVKAIRKGQKGLVVLAGDVSPVDVLTHIPVLCEEASIPYVYVRSKVALGSSSATRRPTCCLMILNTKADNEFKKAFEKCNKDMKSIENI